MKRFERVRRSPGRRRAAVAALVALCSFSSACGGDDAEPVTGLAVQPNRLELPYGTFREIELAWSPRVQLDGLEGSPRVFLHLLDEEGDLVRTFDQDLPGPWRVGSEMSQRVRVYQSLLAQPLPAGSYDLTAGLYDAAGNRWALDGVGEPVGRREYRIATIEVPSGGDAPPTAGFSASWSPNQAGTDRQVVAYRTLAGDGSIVLTGFESPGTLWLEVGVPVNEAGGFRRRFLETADGGDAIPRVAVAAGCSGFESRVSGEGSHRVDVPVEPTAEGEGCEITLRPNFVMESAGDRRSVNLEVLGWSPAG